MSRMRAAPSPSRLCALLLAALLCAPLSAQIVRRPPAEATAAARLAFPSPSPIRDGDGVRWTFRNHQLIETSFGPVLISEGRADGRDMAHATSGRLDVTYFSRVGGALSVRRRFPNAVTVGSFGAIGEWSLSGRFTSMPVIYASGGFTGQGITEGCTILTEIAPSGPRTIATIPDVYNSEGAGRPPIEDVTGRIGDIVRDRQFTVRYTGTARQVRRYVRRGAIFERQGSPVLTHCGAEQ